MALNAAKAGQGITAASWNELMAMQPFQLIYEGIQRDAKTGSGVVENNLANYSYCARFTLVGSRLSRIELEVDRDGTGADLIVQIRSGMVPGSGTDGTLVKQVVVPKEFIPLTKAYWSIPIGLSGLTSDAQYWIVVQRNGDATNKLDWVGESAEDASYPAYYRVGDSGNWTANNALHFRVFSGASGEMKLVHGIYAGTGYTTVEYDGEVVSKVYRYLPPADGPDGGIRDVLTYSWSGEYLVGGDV